MKKSYFPIIDLHTDYVLACYEKGKQFKSRRQINFSLLKKTGVKIIFAGFSYDDLLKDTDLQFSVLLEQSKREDFQLILSKKDLKSVFSAKNRKIGMILHLEGGDILKGNIEKFYSYYDKGVRSIGLTHSHKNCLAAGNKENPNIPLTNFGEKIVKLAQKLGIVVDLAHLNEQGFYQTLKLLTQPPLVSHACAYKLCPDPRNLKDEQIKKIAEQNGIIGIFFSSKYVRNDGKKATIDDVVNHFFHIAEIGSIDVLAIGSDFGGITTGVPVGLENVSKLLVLLEKLKDAGFSKTDLEKITYKNALRVLSKILKT